MRLPHRATLLRPSTVTDAYGDLVDGPLAPVGEAFAAWLQVRSSTEGVPADGEPVVTSPRLYWRDALVLVEEDDVIEVDGKRYSVEGDPYAAVNPRGRARFWQADLKRVTRGGN